MLGVELLLPDVSYLFFFRTVRTKGTTAQLDDILILKQRSNKVSFVSCSYSNNYLIIILFCFNVFLFFLF